MNSGFEVFNLMKKAVKNRLQATGEIKEARSGWLKVGMMGEYAPQGRKLSVAYSSNGIACGAVLPVSSGFEDYLVRTPKVQDAEWAGLAGILENRNFWIYRAPDKEVYDISNQRLLEAMRGDDVMFFVRSREYGFTFPYEGVWDSTSLDAESCWNERKNVALTERLTPYIPLVGLKVGNSVLKVGSEGREDHAGIVAGVQREYANEIEALMREISRRVA